MKIHQILPALIMGLSLSLIPCADAQGKGNGKGKGKGKKPPSTEKVTPSKKSKGKSDKKGNKPDKKSDKDHWRVDSKFKDSDRDSLVSFWDQYKGNDRGLPPGLAKNLRRGKPLPPGWDKKIQPGWRVDDDYWNLLDRVAGSYLPKGFNLPKDTGMFLLGDRLIRVHEPTREVVDFVRIPNIKF